MTYSSATAVATPDHLHYRLTLTAHAMMVRVPRKLVEIALDNWNLPYLKDRAALIISELVTNSLKFAPGTEVEVGVRLQDGWVHLEVRDGAPQVPVVPGAIGLADEGGRGLWVCEHLSDKFGIDPDGTGKTTWVMLQCDPAPEDEP